MSRTRAIVVGVVTSLTLLALASPASAYTEYRKEFMAKYVKKDSAEAKDKSLAEACDKAKCNICHEGKSKANRNAYGRALSTLLTEEDRENPAKIKESLDKVATMKVDEKDPKAPCFGDRLKAGQLPVELKK